MTTNLMPDTAEQRRRLQSLCQDTAGWGALLVLSPPGDVSIGVPIAPKLRGYEIVSATDDETYDIWKMGRVRMRLYKTGLKKSEVGAWLAENTPPEEEFMEHGQQWVEDVLDAYGVPKRHPQN